MKRAEASFSTALILGVFMNGCATVPAVDQKAGPEAAAKSAPKPEPKVAAAPLDKEMAMSLADLRAAAKAGEVKAQSVLGYRYASGAGVGVDAHQAFEWYGDPSSLLLLPSCLLWDVYSTDFSAENDRPCLPG